MRIYRKDNLVYIPISKNASSTYLHVFKNVLKWESDLSENIDWDTNVVFSHISNPYTRHLRGTTQFIHQNNIASILDDERFAIVVANGFFDHHSIPLSALFGVLKEKITWIPIDQPGVSGDTMTCAFLEIHGYHLNESSIPNLNQSTLDKKIIQTKLENIFNSLKDKHFGLWHLLDDDWVLYLKSLENKWNERHTT